MSQLAQDTAVRANNASSWGTASDGNTWTKAIGTGTISISSNEAVMVSSGADTIMQIGSGTSANFDAAVRIAINNVNDIAGIVCRFSSASGGSGYKFIFYTGGIHINKTISGANTPLVTTAFTPTLNSFYWFRMIASGTSLTGKIWADGSAESTATTATITDSSITTAGGYALLGNSNPASTGIKYDHYTVTDGTPGVTGTTEESDTFIRTSQTSTWGTSTGGSVWYNRQGASTSLSTSGTQGKIASSATVRTHSTVGTSEYTDQEVIARITPSSTTDDFGVDLRMTGDSSINGVNGYRVNISSGNLVAFRLVGGAGTQVGSNVAKTITASTSYWLRARVTGANPATIQARFWTDGNAEITNAWDISQTDSPTTPITNGPPGLTGIAVNSTGILYDHFASGDITQPDILAGSVTEASTQTELVTALMVNFAKMTEASLQTEQVTVTAVTSGASAIITEASTQTELVTIFAYYNATILDVANQIEQVTAANINFTLVTEASLQTEQVTATSINFVLVTEASLQTEQTFVMAFNLLISSVTEASKQAEQVTISAITVSPQNVQMQASDLLIQYARIKSSAAGAQLRILATTYYGNNTNNQVIFGELDALLQNESISNLHVMRTGADVTAFLRGFSYASNVQADQPAAYYRLDELTGLYAYDISNNSANAVLTNTINYNQPGALAVSTDGSMGFNGTTGYATIPGFINPANWPAITLECWVNPSASLSPSKRIAGNENPSISNKGALLQAFSSSIIFDLGFGSTYSSLAPSYTMSSGSWYHIVATYDNAFQKIYVNGSVIGSTASANLPIAASTYPFYIAKNVLTTLDGFPGLIDELAIYSYALSSARISAHYLAGTNP